LIRLTKHAKPTKPITGHRRVGSGGNPTNITTKKRSNTSLSGVSIGASSLPGVRRDSQSTIMNGRQGPGLSISVTQASVLDSRMSASEITGTSPMSPTLKASLAGRRPSRSAEPPEAVPERSEESGPDHVEGLRSRPPSPVLEEPHSTNIREGQRASTESSKSIPIPASPVDSRDKSRPSTSTSTPKRRRASLAPSERSIKSTSSSKGKGGMAHPGVIRMHACFIDAVNLYFVLDLASNGEMLGVLRKVSYVPSHKHHPPSCSSRRVSRVVEGRRCELLIYTILVWFI